MQSGCTSLNNRAETRNLRRQSYDVQSHAGSSSTWPQQHPSLAATQPWQFL